MTYSVSNGSLHHTVPITILILLVSEAFE